MKTQIFNNIETFKIYVRFAQWFRGKMHSVNNVNTIFKTIIKK